MLPPAVKKMVVCVAVIRSRKPPSMCIHSVAHTVGSGPQPSVLGSYTVAPPTTSSSNEIGCRL